MRLLNLIVLLTIILVVPPSQADDKLVFIINTENPIKSLSAENIRDYYLKKTRLWPDGSDIRFIDRPEGSELRKSFLTDVIKKTAADTGIYWIRQQTLSGKSAPLQEKTDLMTIQFVSMFKGAIGYISSGTTIKSKKVKTISVNNAD